jgi:hypothetical protein
MINIFTIIGIIAVIVLCIIGIVTTLIRVWRGY